MSLKNILAHNEAARPTRIRKWMLKSKIVTLYRRLQRMEQDELWGYGALSTLNGDMASYYAAQSLDILGEEILDLRIELRRLIDEYEALG